MLRPSAKIPWGPPVMRRDHARAAVFGLLTTLAILLLPGTALAGVPSSTALDGVFMVDGPVVHDVVLHGSNTWIGGRFEGVENQNGSRVASATGLTVFGSSPS